MSVFWLILIIIIVYFAIINIIIISNINKIPNISLSDVLDKAQTGDILISSSNISQFTEETNMRFPLYKRLWFCFSKYIQKGVTGPWTHVGLIIRDGNTVYLLEAVSDDIYKYDLLKKIPCSTGLRLINLSDKIIDYNGICAWQPLYSLKKELPNFEYIKNNLISVLYDKKFKVKATDVIKTIFFGPNINKPGSYPIMDKEHIMCSETLYYLYYKLGIVTGKYDASQVFPHMYGNKFIDLTDSYKLGDPMIIKPN